MGKTVCTPEMIETISNNIKTGLTNHDSAAISGITEQTFYNWLNRGEKALVSDEVPEREEPYVQFTLEIRRAIPVRKQNLIGRIQLAAQGKGEITETRRVYKNDVEGNRVLTEEIVTTRPVTAHWQAAAWLLERLHSDEFGRKQVVQFQDWKKTLPEGVDADQVEREFVELMTMAAERNDN